MVEVKVESHKDGVASYWLTSLSFHVNRPFHSWDTTLSKFDLKNPRWWWNRSRQFHITSNGINRSCGFRDMASTSLAQELLHLTSFGPWVSPYGANGRITMTVQFYKFRQVHKWAKPIQRFQRSAFRKVWTQFVPNLTSVWSILVKWANDHGMHNYRLRQFHKTWNGENPSSGCRDMDSANLAAACPAARPPGPWRQYPSSLEGWGVKTRTDEPIWDIRFEYNRYCEVNAVRNIFRGGENCMVTYNICRHRAAAKISFTFRFQFLDETNWRINCILSFEITTSTLPFSRVILFNANLNRIQLNICSGKLQIMVSER